MVIGEHCHSQQCNRKRIVCSIFSTSSQRAIPLPGGVFSRRCLLHTWRPEDTFWHQIVTPATAVTSSVGIMIFGDIIFVFIRWKLIGFFTVITEFSVSFRDNEGPFPYIYYSAVNKILFPTLTTFPLLSQRVLIAVRHSWNPPVCCEWHIFLTWLPLAGPGLRELVW